MSSNGRWINTRVVIDMASGAVLSTQGFFYRGPVALAATPEEQMTALQGQLDAAVKDKDTTLAELAKLRKQIAELQKAGMSDEDRQLFEKLKTDAAKAEEDKKRAEGKFDEMSTQLIKKHETELKAREDTIGTLSKSLRETLVSGEFARAAALFGATGKTILTPEIAEAYLGRYVHVEDVEGSNRKVIVVKNDAGQVIVNAKTGKPAAFSDALLELIESRPDKDSILRGSGKSGSGNSGGLGGGGNGNRDLANPTTAGDLKDPKVRAAVKQKHDAAGGIVSGSVFEK